MFCEVKYGAKIVPVYSPSLYVIELHQLKKTYHKSHFDCSSIPILRQFPRSCMRCAHSKSEDQHLKPA